MKTSAPVSGRVVRVKLLHSSETCLCVPPASVAVELDTDASVIVPTRHGSEIGRVLGAVHDETELRGAELFEVIRQAEADDLDDYERNRELADELLRSCRRRLEGLNLAMKLAAAHIVFSGGTLILYFTAEKRIDFRRLIGELSDEVGLRIDLQQVGMRDETRIVGGAGICGRVLCCNGVTDRRPRVTVRMARDQGLSLDTRRISGLCGRLLCCLSYEYDYYQEVRRSVPKEGKSVYYQGDRFRVMELNALTKRARISGADGAVLGVGFGDFRFDEANRRWEVSPV
ncbi:MAG: regulatory iron-sulfur-containing complex subunit RicT [Spirochaetaceae bacterium]|nr:regulatory iron-sulfur-containing complex subunit RicT [Spirochaetaceae bacterium]